MEIACLFISSEYLMGEREVGLGGGGIHEVKIISPSSYLIYFRTSQNDIE